MQSDTENIKQGMAFKTSPQLSELAGVVMSDATFEQRTRGKRGLAEREKPHGEDKISKKVGRCGRNAWNCKTEENTTG